MTHSRLETMAISITRRFPRRAIGAAGIGAMLRALISDDTAAKKKKKKKRKKNATPNTGCPYALCRGECRPDCPPPIAKVPFPRHVNYSAGTIAPSSFNQAAQDNHVRAAYAKWKANYLVAAGRDASGRQIFRIAFGKPGRSDHAITVSEGQGYGMVIVAHMAGDDPDAQEIFDGLWRFRLAHPSEIDGRLMDWRVPGGDGNDSAFDGDCDMAYALLLADAQFGSDGAVHYRTEFDQTIAGILEKTIGPTSRLPMLGDWTAANGATYNQNTPRTSDFMPGHFRAFRRATDGGVWNAVVAACQDVIDTLQASISPDTGLLPDFVQEGPRPADPDFLEGPHDGDFAYNAGRDPWRLATDALLNGDPRSAAQARKMTGWVAAETGGDPGLIRAGYTLDGDTWPDSDYFTTFFAAPLGVAAMTEPLLHDWLDAIYGAVYERSEDYYEDSVTLICLLVMSGNFWDATLLPSP